MKTIVVDDNSDVLQSAFKNIVEWYSISDCYDSDNPPFCFTYDCHVAYNDPNGCYGHYVRYDVSSDRLIECAEMTTSYGHADFYTIPSIDIAIGDIVFIPKSIAPMKYNASPAVVLSIDSDDIEVYSYEKQEKLHIAPVEYVLFGRRFYFVKLVHELGEFQDGQLKSKFLSRMISDDSDIPHNLIDKYFSQYEKDR